MLTGKLFNSYSSALNEREKSFREKFIKKFSEVNKNSPKLAKYIEGIKIVKPALIMGGIYYLAIPFISTFWAERIKPDKSQSKNQLNN